MSPILVRPVREQLEHDRVIRLLQAKYKRKFDVAMNPGHEQTAPVGGPPPWYPDLVLHSPDKVRRFVGVVEVETAESVNHLEAMSQWGAFGKLGVAFHLYVPAGSVDTAKRLCAEFQIAASEMWTYSSMGEQIRFTLVHKVPDATEVKAPAPAPVKVAPAKPLPAAPAKSKLPAETPAPTRRPRVAAPAPAAKATARSEAARKTTARSASRPAARPARAGASSAASRAKKTSTRRTAASSARARTTKTAARPAARKPTARAPKRK